MRMVGRNFSTGVEIPDNIAFISWKVGNSDATLVIADFYSRANGAIEVVFKPRPLAYRSMDEGSWLSMYWPPDENDFPLKPVMLIEKGSDFLTWLPGYGEEEFADRDLLHLMFFTMDDVLEILCDEMPAFRKVPLK
ncbi:hypothetical protein FRC91_14085 [Bradymonadales bacterium TMQ1]|nr:hypothetical protein FRC91_14085 [Bradymonadales bacterium TMQ1]